MNASTSDLYHIEKSASVMPEVTAAGLLLNLKANKDNDAVDRDSWTSVTSS